VTGGGDRARCPWAGASTREIVYHDEEWGVPLRDERGLFELLILEGAQAGLSWATVLAKRARYREAFDGFDPEHVARFDERRVERLLVDPGLIRHRQKMRAAVANARACLALRDREGGLGAFLWGFVDGRPVQNAWRAVEEVPAKTAVSERMSAELRRRGFAFVGPTTCYALMQGAGLVNDHVVSCFRHAEVAALGRSS
jgi:DNA-3-methyladenine glycosylase I